MPFPQCKVYSDGSHYIAIPHTTRPYRPRRKPKEEIIAVTEELAEEETKEQALLEQSAPSQEDAPMPLENIVKEATEGTQIDDTLNEKPAATRLMTKKELFEELYARYQNLPRYKRKALILKEMRPYFKDMDAARLYVETNTWRKVRNLIARRTRMVRKINLQEFNYFVTVTYFYGHCFQGGGNFAPLPALLRFMTPKGAFTIIFAPNSVNLRGARVQGF